MTALIAEVGQELPSITMPITRTTLVRYAGASGDFNPIHYSDHAAHALGLDGCLAHGMLTMGAALRVVTDWCGDPSRVLSYKTRFARPVPVPDDGVGASVEFGGTVKSVKDGIATVALTASCAGTGVLAASLVEVRLD